MKRGFSVACDALAFCLLGYGLSIIFGFQSHLESKTMGEVRMSKHWTICADVQPCQIFPP